MFIISTFCVTFTNSFIPFMQLSPIYCTFCASCTNLYFVNNVCNWFHSATYVYNFQLLSWLNTTVNIDIQDIIDIFSISISNIVFSVSQQPTGDVHFVSQFCQYDMSVNDVTIPYLYLHVCVNFGTVDKPGDKHLLGWAWCKNGGFKILTLVRWGLE